VGVFVVWCLMPKGICRGLLIALALSTGCVVAWRSYCSAEDSPLGPSSECTQLGQWKDGDKILRSYVRTVTIDCLIPQNERGNASVELVSGVHFRGVVKQASASAACSGVNVGEWKLQQPTTMNLGNRLVVSSVVSAAAGARASVVLTIYFQTADG
jgi:hypothetical protein